MRQHKQGGPVTASEILARRETVRAEYNARVDAAIAEAARKVAEARDADLIATYGRDFWPIK